MPRAAHRQKTVISREAKCEALNITIFEAFKLDMRKDLKFLRTLGVADNFVFDIVMIAKIKPAARLIIAMI